MIKKSKQNVGIDSTLKALSRRNIRYWCFRFQTALRDTTSSLEGAPVGLKDHFEALDWFSTWETFAVQWDVGSDDPFSITPLREDPNTAWNTILLAEAKVLPSKE